MRKAEMWVEAKESMRLRYLLPIAPSLISIFVCERKPVPLPILLDGRDKRVMGKREGREGEGEGGRGGGQTSHCY